MSTYTNLLGNDFSRNVNRKIFNVFEINTTDSAEINQQPAVKKSQFVDGMVVAKPKVIAPQPVKTEIRPTLNQLKELPLAAPISVTPAPSNQIKPSEEKSLPIKNLTSLNFSSQSNGWQKQKKVRLKKSTISTALLSVILFLSVVSTYKIYRNNQIAAQIITTGTQKVDAATVDPANGVALQNDTPSQIQISSLSLNTKITKLELDQNGQVETPKQIDEVGLYSQNKNNLTSNTATNLVIGHESGWTEKGIFTNLKDLAVGGDINIQLNSGTNVHFKVSKKYNVKSSELKLSSILKEESGKNKIVLMTSSSNYSNQSQGAETRLVIEAYRF